MGRTAKLAANRAWAGKTGLPVEETVGQLVGTLAPFAAASTQVRTVLETLAAQSPTHTTLTVTTKDGPRNAVLHGFRSQAPVEGESVSVAVLVLQDA